MLLPFALSSLAETPEKLPVGQLISGTKLRVQREISGGPGYAQYGVRREGSDEYFICQNITVVDSGALEAAATNALFCKGVTGSRFIANVIEAGWLKNGSFYQVLDCAPDSLTWPALYGSRLISADDFEVAASDLLRGLLYLHKTEIVHGALSPACICVDAGVYKIADFFCARNLRGQAFDPRVEEFYPQELSEMPKLALAPEVLAGAPPSRESDLYSLGAAFFFMLTGEFPFNAGNEAARPQYLAELRSDLSPAAVDGLRMMLDENPKNRNMFAIMSRLAPIEESEDQEMELEEV